MNGSARWLIATAVAIGLTVLAGVAVRWGWGHAKLEDAFLDVEAAVIRGERLKSAQVADGMQAIQCGLKWQARADAYSLVGIYALSGAEQNHGDVVQIKQARDALEQAVRARPAMPHAWAHLALAKYLLGETDARFRQSLELAIRLGPWEREVHRIATDLGLAVLDEVPPPLRAAILENVRRGALRQSDLMVNLALKRGRLAEVCSLGLAREVAAHCTDSSGKQ